MFKSRNLRECLSLKKTIPMWLNGLVVKTPNYSLKVSGSSPELTVLFSIEEGLAK